MAKAVKAVKVEVYYLTIIHPDGNVVNHITTKDELCEEIQTALGGEFNQIKMPQLVARDVMMRERIKGRKVYVLDVARGEPNHQFFKLKGGYYKDGFPEMMTAELHKKWWVKTLSPVRGSLVAVGKKPHYNPAVPVPFEEEKE
jgi:hypothetical protein